MKKFKIILISILVVLAGCKTVSIPEVEDLAYKQKSSNRSNNTTKVPGSDKMISSKYSCSVDHEPNVYNTKVNISIKKEATYEYETIETRKIISEKKLWLNAITVGGGVAFAGGYMLRSTDRTGGLPLIVLGLIGFTGSVILPSETERERKMEGFPKNYNKSDNLDKNTAVTVECNGNKKTFYSDYNGRIEFDVIEDFGYDILSSNKTYNFEISANGEIVKYKSSYNQIPFSSSKWTSKHIKTTKRSTTAYRSSTSAYRNENLTRRMVYKVLDESNNRYKIETENGIGWVKNSDVDIVYANDNSIKAKGTSPIVPEYDNGIPNLVATAEFIEPSGNNLLDAEEKATIRVKISNKGSNAAFDVGLNVHINNPNNIIVDYPKEKFDEIDVGETKIVEIILNADYYIGNDSRNISINFSENGGFIPAPVSLKISTQKMLEPELKFLEVGIEEIEGGDGDNIIENGELILATVLIQNVGQGTAKNVNSSIEGLETGIFLSKKNQYPSDKNLGNLAPNQTVQIQFAFSVSFGYTGGNNLPLEIVLSESKNRFGSTNNLGLRMKEQNLATNEMIVDGNYQEETEITEASLSSDVDKNIPNIGKKHKNRYALIIGNEHYVKNNGLASDVSFAINDAFVFKKYAIATLGIPEDNIYYVTDATSAKMDTEIKAFIETMAIKSAEKECYIYYAGHGYYNEKTKEGYMMPVNVKHNNLDDAIKLDDFFRSISSSPVKSVTVFLDACFSGGGRDGALVEARAGITIKPKDVKLQSNLVVFAATSGDEVSKPYKDQQHGLFTYYLLKELQKSKGKITYEKFADNIIYKVEEKSLYLFKEKQSPKVNISPKVQENWGEMKFNN